MSHNTTYNPFINIENGEYVIKSARVESALNYVIANAYNLKNCTPMRYSLVESVHSYIVPVQFAKCQDENFLDQIHSLYGVVQSIVCYDYPKNQAISSIPHAIEIEFLPLDQDSIASFMVTFVGNYTKIHIQEHFYATSNNDLLGQYCSTLYGATEIDADYI